MKIYKSKILVIIIILFILGCAEINNKNNFSKIINTKNNIDSSKIELIVERGAFHYDKFVLLDTTITFYPSSNKFDEKYDKYNHILKKNISKQKRNELINYIIDNGFFKMKDEYHNQTSCNSPLIVTFKLGDKTKKIVSDDFERDCPELLKYIENQIVILHNKNLERIFLPG